LEFGGNQASWFPVYAAVHKPLFLNDLGRTMDRDYRCRARSAAVPSAGGGHVIPKIPKLLGIMRKIIEARALLIQLKATAL
jgi:hypothetical protein